MMLAAITAAALPTALWTDPEADPVARAVDMIGRMTLPQKAASMQQQVDAFAMGDGSGRVAAIYNAECLHGPKAHGYTSTVFPVGIAQAATFDPELVYRMARATSDDLRSSWNVGQDWSYCFAPDVNLIRDPRYGRGQEAWGEDPWLTSMLGYSFVVGLQNGSIAGTPEVYATCKHLIAYDRKQGYSNAVVDPKNLVESYLPGWEGCAGGISKGGAGAGSVMCSYGVYNDVPTCENVDLLDRILRTDLGFADGVVVSDCGAVGNACSGNWTTPGKPLGPSGALDGGDTALQSNSSITDCSVKLKHQLSRAQCVEGKTFGCDPSGNSMWTTKGCRGVFECDGNAVHCLLTGDSTHSYPCRPGAPGALSQTQKCEAAATASAVRAGTDMNCGGLYRDGVVNAVRLGFLNNQTVDKSLKRVLAMRHRLGMYDAPNETAYSKLDPKTIRDSAAHRALALEAAKAAIILLKNAAGVLPLGNGTKGQRQVKKLAVVGPLANDSTALMGEKNYYGTPPFVVTHLDGVVARAQTSGVSVTYHLGSPMDGNGTDATSTAMRAAAVAAAKDADAVIAVIGHDCSFENEGQDRTDATLGLPPVQLKLAQALHDATRGIQTPVIIVLVNGLAISTPWVSTAFPAVVETLRGGQSAGTALASMLFGDFSPSGRMPYSVVAGAAQLPSFGDMDLVTGGRTYRYYNISKFRKPLVYQFGDGISYTTWKYSNLKITPTQMAPGAPLDIAARGCAPVTVTATLTNTGNVTGREVAQLYVSIGNGAAVNTNIVTVATSGVLPPGPVPCWPDCSGPAARPFHVPRPNAELRGAVRTGNIAPGASVQLNFTLSARDASVVYLDGQRYLEPGVVGVHVGGSAPHGLASSGIVSGNYTVPGFAPLQLDRLCPLSARQFWHPVGLGA